MKIKIESKFLKAGEDVQGGDIVQLLDEGKWNEINTADGVKNVLQFEMQLPDKKVKTYTMNVTSQKIMLKEYGDDSADWMRKDFKVHIVSMMSFGKLTKVLYLTPPHWDTPEGGDDIPVVND